MKVSPLAYLTLPAVFAAASVLAAPVLLLTIMAPPPRADVTIVTPEFAAGFAPTPQPQTTRTWLAESTPHLRSFRVQRAAVPSRLIAYGDSLFVLSHADRRIHRYAPDGRLLRRYGDKSEDANPISDFAVTQRGLIWTADPNGTTEAFELEGPRVAQLPQSIHAVTLAAIDDRLVIQPVATRAFPNGDAMLLMVDDPAQPVRVESFVREHERFGMAVSGIPVAASDAKGFFFVTRAAGLLAAYSSDGALRYAVHTVSGQGVPNLEITRSGATRLPSHGREFVRDIAVHGRYVLTLSDVQPANQLQPDPDSVLDAYDGATGHYVVSIALPFRVRAIAVMANELYGASNNDITVWALPQSLRQ